MENDATQFRATDVEQAIERGLSFLGVSRDEVKIEVIDEGRRGLLGLGARDAVVRLEPVTSGAKAAPGAGTPETSAKVDSETNSEDDQGTEYDAMAGKKPAADESAYRLSEEQIAETARQVLDELLNKMGIQGQVVIRPAKDTAGEPSPIVLDVQGDNLDTLIGQRGKVLNALQHITRLIVSREIEEWVDLVVDVERYKERRAQSLRKLAKYMAERVARSAQPIALEPMPPNERREIHIALREHPTVTTQSVGQGDDRRVTIIPKH